MYLPYDTKFIFAEINGDIVYWDVSDGTFMEKMRYESAAVGRGLYTKALRKLEGLDVNGAYKHAEGWSQLYSRVTLLKLKKYI